jgi:hypothetical protein
MGDKRGVLVTIDGAMGKGGGANTADLSGSFVMFRQTFSYGFRDGTAFGTLVYKLLLSF